MPWMPWRLHAGICTARAGAQTSKDMLPCGPLLQLVHHAHRGIQFQAESVVRVAGSDLPEGLQHPQQLPPYAVGYCLLVSISPAGWWMLLACYRAVGWDLQGSISKLLRLS